VREYGDLRRHGEALANLLQGVGVSAEPFHAVVDGVHAEDRFAAPVSESLQGGGDDAVDPVTRVIRLVLKIK
jgi:hypothetical protein